MRLKDFPALLILVQGFLQSEFPLLLAPLPKKRQSRCSHDGSQSFPGEGFGIHLQGNNKCLFEKNLMQLCPTRGPVEDLCGPA